MESILGFIGFIIFWYVAMYTIGGIALVLEKLGIIDLDSNKEKDNSKVNNSGYNEENVVKLESKEFDTDKSIYNIYWNEKKYHTKTNVQYTRFLFDKNGWSKEKVYLPKTNTDEYIHFETGDKYDRNDFDYYRNKKVVFEKNDKDKLGKQKENKIEIDDKKKVIDTSLVSDRISINIKILNDLKINAFYHMTHINNLDSIIRNGLYPHNNTYKKTDISNVDVNDRRVRLEPIYHKQIHSYVPFYFNPRNAMLFRNQKKFGNSIVILQFKNSLIDINNSIITNANASADNTLFTSNVNHLNDQNFINLSNVFADSWNNYGNPNYQIKQTMMAELLIPIVVKNNYIEKIICMDFQMKKFIDSNIYTNGINVVVDREKYFA
ncbi:DUF4433 domain-containing protein [Aliarcobacter cryaerophilus]|uniref:DUF4433 domain-containing protein n=1 Tax=Aliarcobacter cryaerophilus TaxID=28198 RepID=UPI0021B69030|nr:DUF4433 domain-containing protein [Aliarcobacter cryaerophilus]MCT7469934.1 DUF4433 domain-containing protein [Aliarcobacter cryaerophilus]